jgi:hypothetical protein
MPISFLLQGLDLSSFHLEVHLGPNFGLFPFPEACPANVAAHVHLHIAI